MKKIVLVLFLIILILVLNRRRSNFYNIQGCDIANLGNTTHDEIYNCFLGGIQTYSESLKEEDFNSRITIARQLGTRIRRYFINLYKYNLERHFKCIVMFIPSRYNSGLNVEVLPQDFTISNFMAPGHERGLYRMKPTTTSAEKRQMMQRLNFGSVRLNQLGGILVGMGFKIALSNPANNLDGGRCSRLQVRPGGGNKGHCIPFNFFNFHHYFQGGRLLTPQDIFKRSRNPNMGGILPKIVRDRPGLYGTEIKNATQNNTGCGDRRSQDSIQWHKQLDSCMSSCYNRSRADCHSAYGASSINDIIVTIDPVVFNRFYAPSQKLRAQIKQDLVNGNFRHLDGFHD